MKPPRALRRIAAALVGLAAAAAAWTALEPIEPHLEVKVRRDARTERFDLWTVSVKVRGGETVEVGLEPQSGPVHVVTMPKAELRSGVTAEFRVQLDDGRTSHGVVRVVQTGRVAKTYDAPLVEPF